MANEFKKGDYVQFLGYPGVASGILKTADLGVRNGFQTPFSEERIELFLVNANENIVCDFKHLWPIHVVPELLEMYGFVKEDNPRTGRPRFVYNGVTISQTGIFVSPPPRVIRFDYCEGDVSDPNTLLRFWNGEKFDFEKYKLVFPSIKTINELLPFLNRNGIEASIDVYNYQRYPQHRKKGI